MREKLKKTIAAAEADWRKAEDEVAWRRDVRQPTGSVSPAAIAAAAGASAGSGKLGNAPPPRKRRR